MIITSSSGDKRTAIINHHSLSFLIHSLKSATGSDGGRVSRVISIDWFLLDSGTSSAGRGGASGLVETGSFGGFCEE